MILNAFCMLMGSYLPQFPSIRYDHIESESNVWNTIGQVLIVWFNDCELGSSSKIAILMIVIVNPVLYDSNTLKDTL